MGYRTTAVALAPVFALQARHVRRNIPRLPEAFGREEARAAAKAYDLLYSRLPILERGRLPATFATSRRFAEMVKNEPRVTGTAIQTVGAKGYDGFALLLVN